MSESETKLESANIRGLVEADLREREATGIRTYGAPLRGDTPIDGLRYAYEEALDLAMYLRKELYEQGR